MNTFHRILLTLFASLCCLDQALAQTVSFRYFRWTPIAFRNLPATGNRGTHISEFEFRFQGSRIPGATVMQIDGDTPPNEGPQQVYDENVGSKWFDFERQPLIFRFEEEVDVDGYRWATANAADFRDPIRWTLEGSDDGIFWEIIDDRTSEDQFVDPVPPRFTYLPLTGQFNLNNAVQVDFTISAGGLTGSSLNVPSGGEVTLNWDIARATSATLTGITPAVNPLAVNSATDNPTATRTYTLTAMAGDNVVTQTVTAFIGGPNNPIVLNEFLTDASRDGVLCDEDGDNSDWIELHNPNNFLVGAGGLFLTTDPSGADRWMIPAGTTIDSGGFLTIFASGKNRANPGSELHTDFTLDSTPSYLALLDSDGSTVIEEFNYPAQQQDASYGHVPPATGNVVNFFFQPTPGAANDTEPGPLAPEVEIEVPSQSFSTILSVPLSTSSVGAQIYFTLDGSIPVQGAEGTVLLNGSVTITTSAILRARAYQNGFAPGPVSSEAYFRVESGVTDLDYELPVVVLDNFDEGEFSAQVSPAALALFEPGATGTVDFLTTPSAASRVAVNVSKSTGDDKRSYRLQFREQGSEDDQDVSLMGLSSDHEWILEAPFAFDRTLLRFPFIHQLSNAVGIYAPRTRLVEVYVNTSGNVDATDYRGIYSLQEAITRNPERIAIERLEKFDRAAPEIEGGYILRIDTPLAGDSGFRSAAGQPGTVNNDARPVYTYLEPRESELDESQETYIRGYIDDLETALFGANFTDPNNGYRQFLDVESAIDFHLLAAFSKDSDILRRNAYLVKDRGERMKFGPISNLERGFSSNTDDRSADPEGWDPIGTENRAYVATREYHWWGRLFEDPDFVQAYNDRWDELRQSEFSTANMMTRVSALETRLTDFQGRNFAAFDPNRPENNRTFPSGASSAPGVSTGWLGEVNFFREWLARRAAWMDTQLLSLAPPTLDAGGSVAAGTNINLGPNGGVLYFRTDGLDPRDSGGAIRSASSMRTSDGTLTIMETTTVFARSRLPNGTWSAPRISTFIVGGVGGAYDEWRAGFFTAGQLADPAISGETADPDGDGIANLLEFGLNLDPLTEDTGPLIRGEIQEISVNGTISPYFTVTFTRRTATAGVGIEPEFSNDLEDPWVKSAVLVSSDDLGNGSEEVVYREAQMLPNSGVRRFARIEVLLN